MARLKAVGFTERKGPGRRKEPVADGKCLFHQHMEECFSIVKEDIKTLESSEDELRSRISAIEPTTAHNQSEIDSMRKIQLATLASALISAIGIVSALAIYILSSGPKP